MWKRKETEAIPAPLLWAGDICACWAPDAVSRVISLGTMTPFAPRGLRYGPSHVAIILPDSGGIGEWVESTTKAPGGISGAQAHSANQRVRDYVEAGGRVECYRPSPIDAFTLEEYRLMREMVEYHFLRRNVGYDLGGALISGTRVLKFSRLFKANLESVFCSELIAALLMRFARLGRRNPTRYNPASLLRELVRAGTYFHAGPVVPGATATAGEITLSYIPRNYIPRKAA